MAETVLLIGLPETGKTTFLAAFWFLVEGQHNTQLVLDELPYDREYLNSILTKWLTCEEFERTRLIDWPDLTMRLRNTITNEVAEYSIPDLSGETFRSQWLTRSWDPQFEAMIKNSNGALLFVHPERIISPIRIDEVEPHQKSLARSMNEGEENTASLDPQYDAEMVPTQVQLVTLLQFIREAGLTNIPYKIGIIVSAWDLVRDSGLSPEAWLKKKLPFLHQYFSANQDYFNHKIYGVSAQGADYDQAERLENYIDATKRIQIVSSDYDGHDITIPIVWLINKSADDNQTFADRD